MRSDGFNALPVEEPTHSVGCPIMRRITGDGVELAVLDQGEGPAVLLLHGFPDSAQLWRHQVPTLVDAGFRVVAPDLRGFGDSDKPADIEAYRVGKSVSDLTKVLDALEIEQANVVGHDWGAGVAWAFALMQPARDAPARGAQRRPPRALRPPHARPAREVLVHAALPVPGGRGDPAQGRLGAAARVDGDAPGARRGDRAAGEARRVDREPQLVPREHAPEPRAPGRPAAAQRHGRHAGPVERRRPLPGRGRA